jgi:serine/threonine-protein kinase
VVAREESELPRRLGDYVLLHRLGQGGMGEVFLARHLPGGEGAGLSVVKTLRTDVDDPLALQRFVDEARVVVRLDHPNICHVHRVVQVRNQIFLSMQHVMGRSLFDLLSETWPKKIALGADVAVYVVGELLDALDYAHALEDERTGAPLALVHRDVSHANVMLSFNGDVKLIDFGLATSTLKHTETEPNVVMGKMAFMAPEQARGDDISAAADQFSVGVVAYELFAGEKFYAGIGQNQLWMHVGRGGYVPARWGELDPDLQAVLGRALHPRADQRWPSCVAFGDALREWHAERAGNTKPRDALAALMQDTFSVDDDVSLLEKLAGLAPRIAPQKDESRLLASALDAPTRDESEDDRQNIALLDMPTLMLPRVEDPDAASDDPGVHDLETVDNMSLSQLPIEDQPTATIARLSDEPRRGRRLWLALGIATLAGLAAGVAYFVVVG